MISDKAVIDKSAVIAPNVEISPFSIIGADVEIGEGTWIGPHAVINGPCKIGRNNKIFQFASIGEDPQDKKYAGEPTRLEVGDNNTFRECTTVSRGTTSGGGLTRIGNNNLFMAYVHIAHDCLIGNDNIFANNASLAGHVIVEDFVVMSGFSGVVQFCHMGSHSFAAMGSMVEKDVPPFVKVAGYCAKPFGLNTVGMKRRGFSTETMLNLRRAYKIIYRKGLTVKDAVEQLTLMLTECPEIQLFINFIQGSTRGIVR